MKWNNLLIPAFGLVMAVIVITADLPAPGVMLVMAGGFGVLFVADLVVSRLMKRRAIQQEECQLAAASKLELDILHAYREPAS